MPAAAAAIVALWTAALAAHSGPPYPVVSNAVAGAYKVSIWTDPDTTDDGTPGGQFWVVLEPNAPATRIAPGTRAAVTVAPLDRAGNRRSANAEPVRGDLANQFAAVVLDHEGRFAVEIAITGPDGSATLGTQVDATYDLRPAPLLLGLYLLPFAAIGALWAKRLLKRRRVRSGTTAA